MPFSVHLPINSSSTLSPTRIWKANQWELAGTEVLPGNSGGGKLLDIAGLHDRHNCMIGSKSMLCYLCNTHVTPLRHTHETWTSSKHRVFEIYMHIILPFCSWRHDEIVKKKGRGWVFPKKPSEPAFQTHLTLCVQGLVSWFYLRKFTVLQH